MVPSRCMMLNGRSELLTGETIPVGSTGIVGGMVTIIMWYAQPG